MPLSIQRYGRSSFFGLGKTMRAFVVQYGRLSRNDGLVVPNLMQLYARSLQSMGVTLAKWRPLRDYLSEWALMRYRVLVEARWLIAMSAGTSHYASAPISPPAEKRIPGCAVTRV